MGYGANLLKTVFNKDKIKASAEESSISVVVANTCEWQEALAKATTHGKKIYVTGGKLVTLVDMFIAAEMGNRKREIAEMKKDKKVHMEFHTRRDATLVVLNRLHHESDDNVARLTNREQEVLLWWKGVPVSKMGNMASKRGALYQQFSGNRGDGNLDNLARWTEAEEANLEMW